MKLITDPKTLSELNAWGDTFVKRLQVEMQNAGVNASGNLSNSIEYTVSNESDGTHISVLADPYFFYAEHGRRAGRIPMNFVSIIEEWLADKRVQIPSGLSPRRFASAIAYKIKRYGSLRYRNKAPIDLVEPVMGDMYPKLGDILQSRVMYYVNDELFNWV
jgi:hypothetical protein